MAYSRNILIKFIKIKDYQKHHITEGTNQKAICLKHMHLLPSLKYTYQATTVTAKAEK